MEYLINLISDEKVAIPVIVTIIAGTLIAIIAKKVADKLNIKLLRIKFSKI